MSLRRCLFAVASIAASLSSCRGVYPRQLAFVEHMVTTHDLHVTEGRVAPSVRGSDSWMRVRAGAMRAVVPGSDGDSAELEFLDRGPPSEQIPLANGEIRKQIGLKLRARDTCNTVYVMWTIAPEQGLAVSVKLNPSASTHSRCGANGYIALASSRTRPLPVVERDRVHVLRADLTADELRVIADGSEVWAGHLPLPALELDGPVGVRSDNGTYDFRLTVRPRDRRKVDASDWLSPTSSSD